MAKILIPTPLRQFTGKQDSVTVTGETVGAALANLTAQFPDLRKQIFNDEGKVRSFVNVYLNDEDIRYLSKTDTPVKAGDAISLVPSIAGAARGLGAGCPSGKSASGKSRASGRGRAHQGRDPAV